MERSELKNIKCQLCGQTLSADANFCHKCGEPVKNKVCSKCKTVNNYNAQFRINCGTKLESSKYPKKYKIRKKKSEVIKESRNPAIYFGIFIFISALMLFIFFKVNSLKWGGSDNTNITQFRINNDLLNEINVLKNRLQRDANDVDVNIMLGNLYFDIDNKSEAILYYKKALGLDSTNSDVRVDMAICYYELGDPETAIKEIEKGLKFHPNHSKAFFNLGIVNYSTGNIAEAAQWWKKFLLVEPQGELSDKVKEYLSKISD